MEKLAENNWSTPQRQSPAAIFIMLMQTVVGVLKAMWPIVVVYIFRTKKDKPAAEDSNTMWIMWSVIIIGLVVFIVGITLLKYWFHKFYIADGKLIIQSGWLKKKTLTVPLQNIHAVHIDQNIWQQVLHVAKISIDSAGSEKVEAEIDALSMKKAGQLKTILLSQVHTLPQRAKENAQTSMQTKLSAADLFKFSLTSNHLEAFFILIALGLNIIDDLKDAFKIDSWGLMESYAMQIAGQTTVVIAILIIAVALLSIFVSIIRTLVKFYNFTIEDVQQGWKISFGLVHHQQKIIPQNKIQILSWRANWLRRKIDFWLLNVQSIGYNKATRKERLSIPVTTLKSIHTLSEAYQKSPVFNGVVGNQIDRSYWIRKTLISGTPVVILIMLASSYWLKFNSLWLAFLIIYIGWYFYKWFKTCRWQVNEEGLQLYTGVWGRKHTLLKWNKIQQVQVDQNLYQRAHQLANVNFITAGGSVELPYIPYSTAKQLTDYVLFLVESRDESWM